MYRIIKAFFILLLFASAAANGQEDSMISHVENGFSPHAIIAIGEQPTFETIHQRMKARNVQGVSIAVIDNGTIAWAKGYGLRDATDKNDSVTIGTLFQCASIGKIISAMAVMQLVGEKKIGLDEDVNLYLRSWKLPENSLTTQKKVTLRMLLSHTSGLEDGYGFEGYYPGSSLPTLQQILNAQPPANNKKLLEVARLPGTEERYSGGGYLIIQQLIEDLSGQKFADYVEQRIFAPLQMSNTTYNYYPDTDLKLPIARGHDDKGKIDTKRKYNLYPEMAAAGPWTTPTDLARLIITVNKASLGEKTVLPDSALLHQMLRPQFNAMGLGPHLKGADKVEGYWHAGNTAGYTGMLFATTIAGQGAVVLTNSNSGEWLALEAIRSIANAYNWPIMQTIKEQPVESIDSYTGIYKIGDKDALVFTQKDNQLYFNKAGSKTRYRLYAAIDGSFRIKEKPDNLKFIFQKDHSNQIIEVMMFENAGSKNIMTKAGN